jgi:hypothetical protein
MYGLVYVHGYGQSVCQSELIFDEAAPVWCSARC